MALVAGQIETLLRDELNRVGDDADARFAAHRHAFERFSRRLPLDSRLVQLYKQLDILIRDMETAQKKAARQHNQYQTQVHANSSLHYLKRRQAELDERLKAYKAEKLELINLAAENNTPKVIHQIREETRAGVKHVPKFIKTLPAENAGSIDFLKNYLVQINNEVKVKTRLKNQLQNSRYDPERVERLLVTNKTKAENLVIKQREAKKWKAARAIRNYMNTMSTTENGSPALSLDDVIKLFTFDLDGSDELEKRVCDPSDRERGLVTLRLVRRFDSFLEEGKHHSAAKLAMSSNVFYSVNTLKRLASTGEGGCNAAIWFATVLFESEPHFAKNEKFVLTALEVCHQAKLVSTVCPHWHALGVFQTSRPIAEKLAEIGALNFALEQYLKMELFTEAAHVLFKQRKFGHLIHLHNSKSIPHTLLLNKFYQEPNFDIGIALFESGDECFGQIMLNLLSRGLKTDSAKFIKHFNTQLQTLIQEDNITDESEWGLIVQLLPESEDKALVLTHLAIKEGLQEMHQHEKDQFDFYN